MGVYFRIPHRAENSFPDLTSFMSLTPPSRRARGEQHVQHELISTGYCANNHIRGHMYLELELCRTVELELVM